MAAKTEPTILQQLGTAEWFCKGEPKEYEGACMVMNATIKSDKDEFVDAPLPFAGDAPIGSGKLSNPLIVCLFGAEAFYLQTLALCLSLRGHKVVKMTSTFGVTINKRIVMGVEKGAIFDHSTITFDVQVESDAPDSVVAEAAEEAKAKCPSVAGVENAVKLECVISKV